MAYFSNNRAQSLPLSVRLEELRETVVTAYGNWRVYRRTLSELQELTPREMADLGINPSMIRRIALEAAYGPTV